MRVYTDPFQTILNVFITLVLVIGFGFLGFKGSAWYFHAVSTGLFAKWTSLGTPPGGAVAVMSTVPQSRSGKTVVKTADGKFYAYKPGLSSHWEEYTWPYPENITPSPRCPGFDRQRPSPPHAIVDCQGSFTWEWQDTEDFYAVLADGSVWRWQYGMGLMDGLLLIAGVTILGGIVGFFLSKPLRKMFATIQPR